MAIRFSDFVNEKTEFEGYMLDLYLNVSNDVAPQINKDKQYIEANDKYIRLLEQIEGLLPEDKKELVEELDNVADTANSIYNEALFIQGLQYGVKLARYLKVGTTDNI